MAEHNTTNGPPVIAITIGDPAGVGPEIIVKAWPHLNHGSPVRHIVLGPAAYLRRAVDLMESPLSVAVTESVETGIATPDSILVLDTASDSNAMVAFGRGSAESGRQACEALEQAIELARSGAVSALVTAPLSKEAIQQAGWDFPGHTELLAARCGVPEVAMMLYIPPGLDVGGEIGLGVVHTTLHQSLRSALEDLNQPGIVGKITLAHDFALRLLRHSDRTRSPRIAVAALNPHASENGLFGDEEARIIAPAVAEARQRGIECTGPYPCDTLMRRAAEGEFDMVVAMYHDQGHIALKLLGMHKSVNVTLGLPIIRTSVAHGTAWELAGTGQASEASLVRAAEVAARLVGNRADQKLEK